MSGLNDVQLEKMTLSMSVCRRLGVVKAKLVIYTTITVSM